MPVKINRHDPPPQPAPPSTYSIDGLSRLQLSYVSTAVSHYHTVNSQLLGEDQMHFLRRLLALMRDAGCA